MNFIFKLEPELNDKEVTRTLFIGNLDPDVTENELKKLFDRFGYIEDIDIKRIPNKKPYAFIKYINLDMAYNAKMEMNDTLIGKCEIKIGFGNKQIFILLLYLYYHYSLYISLKINNDCINVYYYYYNYYRSMMIQYMIYL